jgi:hypothetical protein
MTNPAYRRQWMIVLTSVVVAGMSVASAETFPAFFREQHPALVGQTLSASGVPALRGIVDSGRNADLRWSGFTPYKTEVATLYEANGYSLLWVQNGRVRPQGLAVIELLQNADAKGLEPEDYDGPRWQGHLLKLAQKPSEQDLVSFDTALTVSAMRYIRAIHCGRVNPEEFKFQLDMGGTAPVGGIHSDPGRVQPMQPPKSRSWNRPSWAAGSCSRSCRFMKGTQGKTTDRSCQRSRRLCDRANRTLAWSA